MRTKTLLIAAAALAVGVTSSMAQAVYSQNVVGYVNIPVPASTKVLIANQLNTTNNTIGNLLPSVAPNTQLFKFNNGYTAYGFDELDLSWTPNANATLNPGEGCFLISPVATTLTFVGEVMQGSLTNTLPTGVKVLRSSMVPQAGLISATLGLPGEANDQLFTFSGGFTAYGFDELDLSWTPSEPNIAVGQAFFYTKAGSQNNWIRNFTVN
jgi:hypothetical protein